MSLKIPKNFVPGFEILIDLTVDDVKEIASIISKIPAGAGPKNFDSLLNSQFVKKDLSQLSPTIYSFGGILLNFEEPIEEISKMLCEAVEKHLENELDKTALEEKLNIIFKQGDNLKSTYKALDLIFDNDITYKKGRIFSDIRLLFDSEIKENSSSRKAVVIHKLKLESSKNGNDENYYFSLDLNDLVKMKELITRAINKEEQIKSDYSNIEFIEITD